MLRCVSWLLQTSPLLLKMNFNSKSIELAVIISVIAHQLPSHKLCDVKLKKKEKNELHKSVFQFMLKKSVSYFLIPATGKFCILCYPIMKDASKQKSTRLHTQQITLYVIANTTKLCTLGSIISEMWLFNASSI